MKKRIMLAILSCALILGLSGCGNKSEGIQMNDDGSIKAYKQDEITEGMYIKSGEKYYPLLNASEADADESNYQWFTEYDKLIPKMKEKDSIVLYSEGEVPESFTFWKMIDFGYTVGIKFIQDEQTGSLTFPGEQTGYCSYSPVGTYVLESEFGETGVQNVRIREVNGKEFKETMLTVDGFMKGLTKDAMYKFWYYQGTVYKSINIKADTHVFIEDYDINTASYVELKDKTFEVNLPVGMENGYWFIDGYGMFKYSGAEKDLILDDNDSKDGKDKIESDKGSEVEENEDSSTKNNEKQSTETESEEDSNSSSNEE